MSNRNDLPLGIRNNNPGNLRRGITAEIPHTIVRGFAVFRTPSDGLHELARLLTNYYQHLGLRTAWDVISRYAPPNENDTAMYARLLAQWCGVPLGGEKTHDLHLAQAWPLIDCMRGIIYVENGHPPPRLSIGGEWFGAPELWSAVERARAL
jgi:hypothetical protein